MATEATALGDPHPGGAFEELGHREVVQLIGAVEYHAKAGKGLESKHRKVHALGPSGLQLGDCRVGLSSGAGVSGPFS